MHLSWASFRVWAHVACCLHLRQSVTSRQSGRRGEHMGGGFIRPTIGCLPRFGFGFLIAQWASVLFFWPNWTLAFFQKGCLHSFSFSLWQALGFMLASVYLSPHYKLQVCRKQLHCLPQSPLPLDLKDRQANTWLFLRRSISSFRPLSRRREGGRWNCTNRNDERAFVTFKIYSSHSDVYSSHSNYSHHILIYFHHIAIYIQSQSYSSHVNYIHHIHIPPEMQQCANHSNICVVTLSSLW